MTVKQFTNMIDLEGLETRPKIVLAVEDDREVITSDYNMYDRFRLPPMVIGKLPALPPLLQIIMKSI